MTNTSKILWIVGLLVVSGCSGASQDNNKYVAQASANIEKYENLQLAFLGRGITFRGCSLTNVESPVYSVTTEIINECMIKSLPLSSLSDSSAQMIIVIGPSFEDTKLLTKYDIHEITKFYEANEVNRKATTEYFSIVSKDLSRFTTVVCMSGQRNNLDCSEPRRLKSISRVNLDLNSVAYFPDKENSFPPTCWLSSFSNKREQQDGLTACLEFYKNFMGREG